MDFSPSLISQEMHVWDISIYADKHAEWDTSGLFY